jgi:transcriptional regulator of acetoin/glycerol metabolism
MSVKARRALSKHQWPGNFRELNHVARFAFAVSDSSYIDVDCLPPPLGCAVEQPESEKCDSGGLSLDSDFGAIADVLQRYRWNVSAAAEHLGISRATLHRRLIAFKLKRPTKAECAQ